MEKGRGYGKGGRGEGGGCIEVVLFSYVLPISHTSLYNSEEESSRAGRAAPDFDWDAAKAGDGNLANVYRLKEEQRTRMIECQA